MFGDLSYSQPRNLYVKKPVQDFVNAGVMLNKTYDTNLAAANQFDMALANIPARDEIKGQLNEELSKYNNTLKEMASTGRYEDYGSQINKLASDFVKNPLIKGIQEDYQSYANYIGTYQKEVNDGKVNRDDFEKSLILHKATYNKPLEIDPLTGMVKNKFQGNTIPQNIEIDKNIAALIKDLKADKIPSDLAQRLPGYTGLVTTEGLSPERVAKIARDYVTSDENVKDLLAFRADTDTKLARLQSNGSLRPYTRADLENLGISEHNGQIWMETEEDGKSVTKPMTNLNNKLFDENGTLNQNIADNLVKAVHMDNEVKKHENLAKNFAYSQYDADYKENWIQKQQNEFQHDFDLEEQKAQNKLQEQIGKNNYYRPFKILVGEKASIDPSQSKAYGLDNFGLNQLTIPEEDTRTSKDGLTLNDKAALKNFKDAFNEAGNQLSAYDKQKALMATAEYINQAQLQGKPIEPPKLPKGIKVSNDLIKYANELRQNPRLAKLSNEELANYKAEILNSDEVKRASYIAKGLLKLRDNGGTVKSNLQEGANVKRDASGNLLVNLELKPNNDVLKTLSKEEKDALEKAGYLVINPNYKHKTKLEGKGEEAQVVSTDDNEYNLKVPVKYTPTSSGNQVHAKENQYIGDLNNQNSAILEADYARFNELSKRATPQKLKDLKLGDIQTMTNINKVMSEGTFKTISSATDYINNLYLDAKKGDRESYIALLNIID